MNDDEVCAIIETEVNLLLAYVDKAAAPLSPFPANWNGKDFTGTSIAFALFAAVISSWWDCSVCLFIAA